MLQINLFLQKDRKQIRLVHATATIWCNNVQKRHMIL
jgi:hypothetical protein